MMLANDKNRARNEPLATVLVTRESFIIERKHECYG